MISRVRLLCLSGPSGRGARSIFDLAGSRWRYRDAILAGSLIARLPAAVTIYLDAEVNQDHRIGPEELVYILQKVAGLR